MPTSGLQILIGSVVLFSLVFLGCAHRHDSHSDTNNNYQVTATYPKVSLHSKEYTFHRQQHHQSSHKRRWTMTSVSTSEFGSETINNAEIETYHNDSIETSGWYGYNITLVSSSTQKRKLSNPDFSMYSFAGFVEGCDTFFRISQHYGNVIRPIIPNQGLPQVMTTFINKSLEWVQENVRQHPSDLFWFQVGASLAQLEGVYHGYNACRGETNATTYALEYMDFYLMNYQAEIGDVASALNVSLKGILPPRNRERCSAIVKVTQEDVFVAHTTWSDYNMMIRMYKYYNFSNENQIGFSSYPGTLHSIDDWYILGSGLVVTETTNGIYNKSLYNLITPNAVPEWLRVIAANTLAVDGKSWSQLFCKHNSGTYNNQFMVINMGLYTKGMSPKQLPSGFLYVVEQMPGYCPFQDVTSTVRATSAWFSYNIPYFPLIYNISGTQLMYQQYGDIFSYQNYARPQIFHQRNAQTNTLESVQRLIRYNDWQNDPLSKCPGCLPATNPRLAISERGDLVPENGTWGLWSEFLHGPSGSGGYDGKVATWSSMMAQGFSPYESFFGYIVCGPTWDQQKPFRWSTAPEKIQKSLRHEGHPDLFQFDWMVSNELFSGDD